MAPVGLIWYVCLLGWLKNSPESHTPEGVAGEVHIRLVISIGCFIKGPPVFYAEHRRPTLKGCSNPSGVYAAERHANLALLSLVGSMALPLTKEPPSLIWLIFYALHRRLVAH